MKRFLGAALVAAAAIGTPSAALARDGCGAGFYRGANGWCHRFKSAVVVRPVIGVYYANRGYWYNNRYWKVRYRHRGYWRYR
jgi:hypothetical protein